MKDCGKTDDIGLISFIHLYETGTVILH